MTEPIDMSDWIARKVQEINAEVEEFLTTHIPLSAEALHEIIISVFDARMKSAIQEVVGDIPALDALRSGSPTDTSNSS